ncbi:hypothetical protein ES319_D13G116900v1 [Gossypium barbadense]|uniref:Protein DETOXIFICATION n=1 Tax=Gossypium barbadense TaxID=3634 RepID=A0A5J5NKT0_GOSBA|nr:hypothetical protein ES319_D13G116900v1 [Gossypium barbadense]
MKGDISQRLLKEAEKIEVEEATLKEKIWMELKKTFVVAAPATFTRFSTFGIAVISQAFIGHIGPVELAAYSLCFTCLLRFGNGVLLGMASALETLCGQAFGAKQYHMLGIYIQRSWIVLFMSACCLLPLYIFTTPLFIALGQDEKIAQVCGYISHWFIFIVFSFIISFTCQLFLQVQSKNMIIAYLAAFSIGIHIFLSWLLTMKLEFGLAGALFSTVLAYWLPNVGQILFVTCGGCKDTWKGFSMLAFKDLCPMVKLSVSSGVMLCLELWYNTILVLLTGNLKNAEVAIDALAIWTFSIHFHQQRRSGRSRCRFISVVGFSILVNSVQPVLSGVAVGAGWQRVVAWVNIASYYLVGIPIGVVLGYVWNMHVKGVWIGMLLGTLLQTIVLVVITWRTDWDKQVTLARTRLNRWFVPESEDNQNVAA